MNTAISINNLSVELEGNKILNDISVEIPRGKIIGLLGPSGAGKTTLIRAILNLQKFEEGSIRILGLAAGQSSLRSKIGYVTQGSSVYPDLTIDENLNFFASLVGADRIQIDEVLKSLELYDQKNNLVSNLSGGQKARVSLAVSLLGNPKLLILDEPTVGLDPVLRRKMWNKFKQLSKNDITVLVTSHVMDEAERCDEILFIRSGKLLAAESKEGILKQTGADSMEKAFLKLSGETA